MNDAPRLLADIGGTNARFALSVGDALQSEIELRCADFPGLTAAAEHYLQQVDVTRQRPREAAFAIAAPLAGDQVNMTNHPWRFSLNEVRAELDLRRLIVLNDFTALAMAIRHLPATDFETVGGTHAVANRPIALLGPGTGLGVSGLIPANGEWMPLQGEGGHVTLAPGNEFEARVLEQLWKRYEHVSAERVLSGPGLVNLYEAICAVRERKMQSYTPADVTQHGLQGSDSCCAEALETFCAWLGNVAGNLVLTLGALGGVYIGGGIVPRLGEYFASSPFRARFEGKGRYVSYLAPVPAFVIKTSRPAFTGLVQSFYAPSPRIEVT